MSDGKLPTEDWLRGGNAATLASNIRAYWQRRGYLAEVWVESGNAGGTAFCSVRSNMINGMPVERIESHAK